MIALPTLTCERLHLMTSIREERLRRVISVVACCRGAKLCAHAARDFRSQKYTCPANDTRTSLQMPTVERRVVCFSL